jgi:hypothetical protein
MPDPNFPGMRVCKVDLDNYDPWRLPAIQTENIALRFPRPDQNIATGPVGGDQLVSAFGPTGPIDSPVGQTTRQPNNTNRNSFFIDGTPYGVAGAPGDINFNSGPTTVVSAAYPTIGAVSPTSGPQIGGTFVLINGTNLSGITSVKFGGVAASFTLISPIQISAISPAYTVAGNVNIAISNSNGVATSYGAFTYN